MSTTAQRPELAPGQVEGRRGVYTSEALRKQEMAEAVMRNLSAMAEVYGGQAYPGYVRNYYNGLPTMSRHAFEALAYRGGRAEEERYNASGGPPRTLDEKIDAFSKAYRDTESSVIGLMELVQQLRGESDDARFKEDALSLLRTLIRYGASGRAADFMEPEPDKKLYVPDIPKLERKKDR